MDDRKVYELERLKLAYKKQILFMASLIIIVLMGIIIYVITVYKYNKALLIISIMLIITGIIGVMTIDQKMKLISKRIKEL